MTPTFCDEDPGSDMPSGRSRHARFPGAFAPFAARFDLLLGYWDELEKPDRENARSIKKTESRERPAPCAPPSTLLRGLPNEKAKTAKKDRIEHSFFAATRGRAAADGFGGDSRLIGSIQPCGGSANRYPLQDQP